MATYWQCLAAYLSGWVIVHLTIVPFLRWTIRRRNEQEMDRLQGRFAQRVADKVVQDLNRPTFMQ